MYFDDVVMEVQTIKVLLEVAILTLFHNVLLGNALCRIEFARGESRCFISLTEEVMTSSSHL
jgi:hypothetical protein